MSSLEKAFADATVASKQLGRTPDNPTLLKLYALYKQATAGDVAGDRPGGFDFVGAAKHDAWTVVKGMSRGAAMQAYIDLVKSLQNA